MKATEGPSNARDGFRPEASCWGRFIIEVLETDLPYWSPGWKNSGTTNATYYSHSELD